MQSNFFDEIKEGLVALLHLRFDVAVSVHLGPTNALVCRDIRCLLHKKAGTPAGFGGIVSSLHLVKLTILHSSHL